RLRSRRRAGDCTRWLDHHGGTETRRIRRERSGGLTGRATAWPVDFPRPYVTGHCFGRASSAVRRGDVFTARPKQWHGDLSQRLCGEIHCRNSVPHESGLQDTSANAPVSTKCVDPALTISRSIVQKAGELCAV